ncbi:MAG TPA: dihydroneopterin aldolase family protein [Thermoplasmata archaeon]|nr:dihydroneopterin aldolase family protein [Thermoplasmata archaeon]
MSRRPRPRGPAALHRAVLTPREALLFEAGVKLGGVFHQYLGTPVDARTAGALARTIARAVELQPYVVAAAVAIDPRRGGPRGRGAFAYRYLTPEMLRVRLRLADGPVSVEATLRHRADLRYPLMRVERVRSPPSPRREPPRRRRGAARSGRTSSP